SFQKNFISGFSFLNNMSITCGKNSFEFALYDKELTETQEKLIQNYFLKVFKGKIDGICIERDKNNYTFLNQVIEKEKIIC
ncbi:hypothetical protein, partial [Mesobacillus thioparans]|uniref:hypothetical protein n=1 Tax=Mesobacillus thioparans TaxID=370439 RepID=UPI0039EE9063